MEKITISDITENCGMRRGIFYYYFRDKEDLILTAMDIHTRRIHARHYGDESWHDIMRYHLEFCISCKELMQDLANQHSTFLDRLRAFMHGYVTDIVAEYSYGKEPDDKMNLWINFYCSGATAIYNDWIRGGFVQSADEIALFLEECLPAGLKEILNS